MDEMEIRHAWKWQIGARGLWGAQAKSGPPLRRFFLHHFCQPLHLWRAFNTRRVRLA